MKINELVKLAHERAKKAGWWDEGKSKSSVEVHMLIVSEIAEATEEVRKDAQPMYLGVNDKPEGEAVELADAVIRICDYFGFKGWDLEAVIKTKMQYNQTRSYRHGNKKL